MHVSEKFAVPPELALLYDFVNSIDQRQYVERGATHVVSDEISTRLGLENWLRVRGLIESGARLNKQDHSNALELRAAIRSLLALDPLRRSDNAKAIAGVATAASHFPLMVKLLKSGSSGLQPAAGASAVGLVVAELHSLSQLGRLDRLKMCASEDCNWMFFDRSKPGNRRWCSSALCGNRHKTRAYRHRQRDDAQSSSFS